METEEAEMKYGSYYKLGVLLMNFRKLAFAYEDEIFGDYILHKNQKSEVYHTYLENHKEYQSLITCIAQVKLWRKKFSHEK